MPHLTLPKSHLLAKNMWFQRWSLQGLLARVFEFQLKSGRSRRRVGKYLGGGSSYNNCTAVWIEGEDSSRMRDLTSWVSVCGAITKPEAEFAVMMELPVITTAGRSAEVVVCV